jgi:hypothetical protein
MSVKGVLAGLVAGVLLAGGGVYMLTSGGATAAAEKLKDFAAKLQEVTASRDAALSKVADLEKVVEERDKALLGYTQYSHYLTAGKKQLQSQAKLLTASVRREEGYTSYFTTSMLGGMVKSSGAVKVSYTADYNFGFDFGKEAYEIVQTPTGIEIRIGRPMLIGKPAVSKLSHKVLTDGLFTDPQAAVIKLQQQAADRVLQQGLEMAKQPAIAALCERSLIKTLGDFLSKQPGVKFVPQITVRYK